jgi:hypothetical protein
MWRFSGLHGHRESSSPGKSRTPTEMQTGDKLASLSERFKRGIPGHRIIIAMLSATYGESVVWTPRRAIGEPMGPIENGMTYRSASHRPARRSRIACGWATLFVGAASASFAEEMKVRDSTLATLRGSSTYPVASRRRA